MSFLAFVLKKIISVIIHPIGMVIALLILSFAATIANRRKAGLTTMVIAMVFLAFASTPIVGQLMLAPLEGCAGAPADPGKLVADKVRYIVVLGGGTETGALEGQIPAGDSTLRRFLEGLRLYKNIPDSKLILSGATPTEAVMGCADSMALLAKRFGIPESRFILETKAWDTGSQADRIGPILGSKKFALVTSAYHMPRAMALFRERDLDPIPAPTNFLASRRPVYYGAFLPRASGLSNSEKAIHEYVGLVWARLKALARF
jgi:uncharacterized SAM-binding protein YcdF (DUF218 family)